jgi:hypothetical protein
MKNQTEYEVFCQFCAIGKRTILASSFEEAKEIAESDSSAQFTELLMLTKPCIVTDAIALSTEEIDGQAAKLDYKNWGSE